MQLVVVGSADAFNSAGRGHSCYWLEDAARRPLMIDFGGTALQGLARLDLDPRALGGVLLTHLHGDHFGGLPFLQVALTYQRPRSEPLVVVGPPGSAERVRALVEITYGEVLRETAFRFEVRELAPGGSLEVEGARVEAFAAVHQDPPERPLCLRVTGRDGSVVAFSGDTEACEGLLAAAAGVDLLVGDCTGLAPPVGPHMTWIDWRAVLPSLTARRVVLSHLGADVRAAAPDALAGVRGGPPVELADDGARYVVTPRART